MNAPNQLSFLPDDYLIRKQARRTNMICASLFVVVMGLVSAAFVISERSTREVEKRHAEVERDYTDAARRIKQVQEMHEKEKRMAQQAELTASLLEKVPRSYVVGEVSNALPTGVSLLDFDLESRVHQETPAAKATGTAFDQQKKEIENAAKKAAAAPPAQAPKAYDVFVKMTGVASNDVQVAQYLKNLAGLKSKVLSDVNLVISDEFEVEKQKVRKFQVEATLNQSAKIGFGAEATDKTKTAAVDLGN